jgi:hypothetical protein
MATTKTKTRRTTAEEWALAKEFVTEHRDEFSAPGITHGAIFRAAKDADLNMIFPKIKTELRKQLKLDYDELRTQVRADREQELTAALEQLRESAQAGPVLELWCDAIVADDPADGGAFAICGPEGEVIWYNAFHPKDTVFTGTIESAATSALNKAVFFAEQVRQENGLDVLAVTVHYSEPDADLLSPTGYAIGHRLAVDFDLTKDLNPATGWTQEVGSKDWREQATDELLVARS